MTVNEVGKHGAISMLTNPYLMAIGIPIVLIVSGALAKKIVRGSRWRPADFFLGVELSLASMASALVYIADLSRLSIVSIRQDPFLESKLAATATFIALCFFLLLWIVSTHQDWEKRSQNPKGQIIWLGGIANLIGAGLLAAFVLFVKGVQ